MKVDQLSLKNFRNIRDVHFFPDRSINFLVGSNGQGKTSIIEALGFLSTLKSFRDSLAANVIQWGELNSTISCTLSTDQLDSGNWKAKLQIVFQASDASRQKVTKTAFANEKAFRSSTQYLSQRFGSFKMGFHTVIFNPSDHDLVRGDPATRRAFLDRAISAEDIDYLKILQKYQRILAQRNALLKSQETVSSEVLMGFTEPLARYASELTLKRLKWIQRLADPLNHSFQRIAPPSSKLRLVYVSNWAPNDDNLAINNNKLQAIHFTGQGHLPSLELLEQSFWKKASALESAEIRAGHSLVGPHRDDWTFFLNDQVLKGHGSQGEVRSALLALKLSEIELFRNETGYRPLFLLDDFSSELDRERRSFLMKFLSETDLQTFVTTTEDASFVGKRYWICNGLIKEGMHDIRSKFV